MKKAIVLIMAVAMLVAASGCAKKEVNETEVKIVDETIAAEGDLVSTDYAPYAGTYTRTEDGSTITLGKDGTVSVSITRLCQLDGKADGIYKGIVKINVKDPNDDPMKMEFLPETGELIATDSKWNYIKNGDSFKFDKKQ